MDIMRLQKKKREKGAEKILEDIMAEKFLSLVKHTNVNIQEAQQIPSKINSKRPKPRHIIIILSKRQRWGFPGGSVVKNLPANAGDTSSSPGPGRSHMLWSN